MPTITPSQLPAGGTLANDDIFIVQQGTIVAKVTYASIRQAMLSTLQSYVDQELATEYNGVVQDIASLQNEVSVKAHVDHTHTKDQVGLSLVENIAPLNMPISTAMQDALDLKMDIGDFTAAGLAIAGTRDW
jgi:hypothetical protein